MASELLKTKALAARIKEPKVRDFDFGLNLTSVESLISDLPEPKPQELLDIQEDVRIQRQQDTMDKARPFLMDESVDFIRRENFDKGSPGRPLGGKSGRIPLAEQDKYFEDIRKAYNKLKKDLGRNPTQGELLKATGKKAQTAVRTATKKFGLELFNKPGEYNVPLEVLQEARKKQTERMQAAKKIEGPTTFQQDRVLKDVKFPNKKMENAFKANVKLYFSYPFGSAEGRKVGATIDSFKKFYPDPKSVSNDTVRRHVNFFRDKLNLKFPLQTYEGDLKRKAILGKEREKLIREVSGFVQERQMIRAKKETGFGRFGENLDLAHRASLKQFKDFSLPYLVDNLGLDTRKLNQEILPPLEREINSAHRERMRLIKNVKPGKVPKEVSKKLEDINLKLSKISLKTNGALQAVLLDEKTLKPFVFNKNYANVIGQGLLDKPVKKLTEADIDFIKTGFPDLAKEAKKIPEKKLTALQELASRTGAGVDPALLMKAGFEEFVKPTGKFAGQVARGVGTAADLAISAGKGGTGLALGALLEADPIITGMSEGKDFGQTARDTFVGSAIDLIPGVNLGSLNEDLIKLADTEEQRIAIQNLIDYQKDYDRFNKDFRALKSYNQLNQVELEELGFTASDLVDIENKLAKRFKDIQTRAPKVYNPEVFSLARELATKEAMKRKENLETGIAGKIFGDRMAKDPNFIENQIQQIMAASTGAEGATDSYVDNYRFLPQEQLTSDELDKRFDMEGGIMAANGGRIGYSSGSDGTALAIEESLEAFQRYLKAGGKLGYKDFIALGNEGVSKFFNTGGRVGFADGPINPKRRTFMKIMAGIASLPIFSKFIGKSEVAKPIVKIAGSSTKMPDWFPDLINKAMFSGTGKKIDADIMKYEVKELPGIEIYRHDDGKVFVSGKNEYGKSYEIEYEPPGYQLVDESGKSFKTKGDFSATEDVPVNMDPDGNMDFDVEVLEDLDQILGSDTRIMEEFATGKKVEKMKSGEFALGKAEADLERAAEEMAESAEYYDEIN